MLKAKFQVSSLEVGFYDYRDPAYKNNRYYVIFVHAYKHHKDWKRFLVKRIMAIEEQGHDQVMKILQALQF